jgi:hypothetical protein
VWILGKRKPSWKPGGPARQEREKAGSWLQTVEEDRLSRMAKDAGDGLVHLQEAVMHRVSVIVPCVAVIQYDHNRNRFSLYCIICFRKIYNLVLNNICIHPLMYVKLC